MATNAARVGLAWAKSAGPKRAAVERTAASDPAGDGPAVGWVDSLFSEAISLRASDVHLEPFDGRLAVRMRVDGVLIERPSPTVAWMRSIASRIKVLANLDIAECRLPQDGRIGFSTEGRSVDLRVSTLATVFGESIVVRILDRAATKLNLEDLGMPDDLLKAVRSLIERPNGLLIVTGPTGSGKTTTLYSALCALNSPEAKLLTAEDPVEFDVCGVVQTSVNAAAGLTFASALRAFLRQDPDVIMVGEIRDAETARIAIQAALTGHLVLSTLHTRDAAGAVARLVDMGVEPFLVSAALIGVVAQRLVRRICPACQEPCEPDAEKRACAQESHDAVESLRFFRGAGCSACGGSGFSGRRGLYELLAVDDDIRDSVVAGASGLALKDAAISKGMRTLRHEGIRAVHRGWVGIDDVLAST